MMWNRPGSWTAAGCLLVLAGVSCVGRKETITVAADRSVTIELEYKGHPRELTGGDAMPSAESGWDVTRTIDDSGDEEEHTLTAARTFAPDADLPASFAAAGDIDGDLNLAFPTTIATETRADGVYYHFRRAYEPRRWQYVRFWEDQAEEVLKELEGTSIDELGQEDRIRIAKSVAGVEAYRQIEFARAAVEEAGLELSPDKWLASRAAVLDVYEKIDWDALVSEYLSMPEELRDAHFEQMSRQFWQAAHEAFARSLETHAGVRGDAVTRFERAFDRAKRYHHITNGLGGHHFDIRVKMPGEVVAHNADRLDDDGTAAWEFDGQAFRDRKVTLMITSRVKTEPKLDR